MTLRINITQIDSTVGDLKGNIDLIVNSISKTIDLNTRIVLLPFNAITGTPLGSLLNVKSFTESFHIYLRKLASKLLENNLGGIHVIFISNNFYENPKDKCLIDICMGKVEFEVIDPCLGYKIFEYEKHKIAICHSSVSKEILEDSPNIVLVSSNSEYVIDKDFNNKNYYLALSKKLKATVLKANMAGASDYHIFPGASYVAVNGHLQAEALWFDEDNISVLFDDKYVETDQISASRANMQISKPEQAYRACLTGLNSYMKKNGFKKIIIGLSGGIDSALVASMAADCIGGKNVYALSLPSKYSSQHSIDDAKESVKANGFNYDIIDIWPIVESYDQVLELNGLTEENLQSRVRANILMALANDMNALLVANGNKSEGAVGYFTMYGDSAGGYAPIRDCYKTLVWEMAKWRNKLAEEYNQPVPIPLSSINKEPSAELSENQKDSDSLPQYAILDSILENYIDKNLSANQIADLGYDISTVNSVLKLVKQNEWKRSQYPTGPRITSTFFGVDRKIPITNRWSEENSGV
ncbi:NAD(+) synthase [Actinomyces sp. zg-332]|uniref:NAD(+) synthase n=1 Tax=Actinomyces sp. zg-332 TaxID=2708340 RepID=UPI00141FD3C8|nr:NAD(+) synthase [Actinomyces sp. zg-332]QPK93640.1 NAD(+) synthase [Actinomyces sp. zg-332]